jgi:hypothetical protein
MFVATGPLREIIPTPSGSIPWHLHTAGLKSSRHTTKIQYMWHKKRNYISFIFRIEWTQIATAQKAQQFPKATNDGWGRLKHVVQWQSFKKYNLEILKRDVCCIKDSSENWNKPNRKLSLLFANGKVYSEDGFQAFLLTPIRQQDKNMEVCL